MCQIDSERMSKRKSPLETISFDFGGTLVYGDKEDYVIYHEILEDLGFKAEVTKLREAGKKASEWWRLEKARTGRIWTEDAQLQFVEQVLSNTTLPNPRRIASRLCELLPHRLMLKAYEDVKPTLSKLKEKGFKCIITSNVSSRKDLEIYLATAGLEGYFDTIVASGSVGYEKPSPEIFRIASELSRTPLRRMMHVGDSYKEDYLGAESVRMKAVLLDRKGIHRDKRCRKISKLTELANLLHES